MARSFTLTARTRLLPPSEADINKVVSHINNSLSSLKGITISIKTGRRSTDSTIKKINEVSAALRKLDSAGQNGVINQTVNVKVNGIDQLKNLIIVTNEAIDRLRILNNSVGRNSNFNIKVGGIQNLSKIRSEINSISAAIGRVPTLKINQSIGQSVNTRAISNASNSISNLNKATAQTANGFDNIGKRLAISARNLVSFTIAYQGFNSLSSAISRGLSDAVAFEDQMVTIAQVTDRSVVSLAGFQKVAEQTARTYGVLSSELVEGATTLAQAGLSVREIEKVLPTLARIRLAPSFDLTPENVEASIAIMQQFGKSAEDLEDIFSSVNEVSAKFAVEAEDIFTAVKRGGGAFANVDKDFNQFIALFSTVRETTRESAESIGTAFRTLVGNLQRTRVQDFLENALGANIRDSSGNLIGVFEAYQEIATKLQDVPTNSPLFAQVIEQLAGVRQSSRIIPILTNFDSAQNIARVASQSGDSLQKDLIPALDRMSTQIVKLQEDFTQLIRTISQNEAFRLLAESSILLARSLVQITNALVPLMPLLAAFTTVSFGGNIAKNIKRVGSTFGRTLTGFNDGGLIPGNGPNKDTVLAHLTKGEYVLNRKAVRRIGVNNLNMINAQPFNTGGLVGGAGALAGGAGVLYALANFANSADTAARKMEDAADSWGNILENSADYVSQLAGVAAAGALLSPGLKKFFESNKAKEVLSTLPTSSISGEMYGPKQLKDILPSYGYGSKANPTSAEIVNAVKPIRDSVMDLAGPLREMEQRDPSRIFGVRQYNSPIGPESVKARKNPFGPERLVFNRQFRSEKNMIKYAKSELFFDDAVNQLFDIGKSYGDIAKILGTTKKNVERTVRSLGKVRTNSFVKDLEETKAFFNKLKGTKGKLSQRDAYKLSMQYEEMKARLGSTFTNYEQRVAFNPGNPFSLSQSSINRSFAPENPSYIPTLYGPQGLSGRDLRTDILKRRVEKNRGRGSAFTANIPFVPLREVSLSPGEEMELAEARENRRRAKSNYQNRYRFAETLPEPKPRIPTRRDRTLSFLSNTFSAGRSGLGSFYNRPISSTRNLLSGSYAGARGFINNRPGIGRAFSGLRSSALSILPQLAFAGIAGAADSAIQSNTLDVLGRGGNARDVNRATFGTRLASNSSQGAALGATVGAFAGMPLLGAAIGAGVAGLTSLATESKTVNYALKAMSFGLIDLKTSSELASESFNSFQLDRSANILNRNDTTRSGIAASAQALRQISEISKNRGIDAGLRNDAESLFSRAAPTFIKTFIDGAKNGDNFNKALADTGLNLEQFAEIAKAAGKSVEQVEKERLRIQQRQVVVNQEAIESIRSFMANQSIDNTAALVDRTSRRIENRGNAFVGGQTNRISTSELIDRAATGGLLSSEIQELNNTLGTFSSYGGPVPFLVSQAQGNIASRNNLLPFLSQTLPNLPGTEVDQLPQMFTQYLRQASPGLSRESVRQQGLIFSSVLNSLIPAEATDADRNLFFQDNSNINRIFEGVSKATEEGSESIKKFAEVIDRQSELISSQFAQLRNARSSYFARLTDVDSTEVARLKFMQQIENSGSLPISVYRNQDQRALQNLNPGGPTDAAGLLRQLLEARRGLSDLANAANTPENARRESLLISQQENAARALEHLAQTSNTLAGIQERIAEIEKQREGQRDFASSLATGTREDARNAIRAFSVAQGVQSGNISGSQFNRLDADVRSRAVGIGSQVFDSKEFQKTFLNFIGAGSLVGLNPEQKSLRNEANSIFSTQKQAGNALAQSEAANIKSIQATISSLQENLPNAIQTAFKAFNDSAEKLSKTIGQFPSKVDLNVNYTKPIEVIINGAGVFNNLQEPLKKIIEAEVTKAIDNFKRENGMP